MRKLIPSIATLGLICLLPLAAHSAAVTHDWTGTRPNGTMSIDVDEQNNGFMFQGLGCGMALGTSAGASELALWTVLGLAGLTLRFRKK